PVIVRPEGEAGTLGEDLSVKAAEARGVEATHTGPMGPVFAGENFDDWKSAVTFMRERQEGEIPGLITHPDLGPIDVVWGRHDDETGKGFGLSHIIAK